MISTLLLRLPVTTSPQIATPPRDPNSFGFAVWQRKPGEEKRIADRLVEIFSAAPKT